MSLKKIRMISTDELSLYRLTSAATRRLENLPHTILWKLVKFGSSENYKRIKSIKNIHFGERCFILGNGPSLAKTNLHLLRNEKTFGLNRIYLMPPSEDFHPVYYVCMNDFVILQSQDEIHNIQALKFINWRHRRLFQDDSNTIFLHETFSPGFSTDLTKQIWSGATVTYATMQIAYYMGFHQVILIGVDHRFKSKGTPHQVITSGEEDPDHFHPGYFAKGTRWQLPDLRTSEYAYRMAKEAFEADGRVIFDATIDGALNIFPKITYQSLFSKSNQAKNEIQ
jgi:hypothetical protein